ncbi:hypothetical protein KUL150_01200 [Alteromonas sp. KUL150]|nr:hypothetical protein KUL150_01200 [Alteromonas sp. KUL150]
MPSEWVILLLTSLELLLATNTMHAPTIGNSEANPGQGVAEVNMKKELVIRTRPVSCNGFLKLYLIFKG